MDVIHCNGLTFFNDSLHVLKFGEYKMHVKDMGSVFKYEFMV